MISELYKQLEKLSFDKFSDIIQASQIIYSYTGRARKLRLELIDDTFIDTYYSFSGNYSFHWEQRPVRDAIYRHDNAPHERWRNIGTFPRHCHDGTQENVIPSELSVNPEESLCQFLKIIRTQLSELQIK
jgi:hypothetical protein